MLSINDLTYYIGGRALYENASLHINTKDKVGLVGINGSGKTTLIKIILGEIIPENLQLSKQKDCSIGVLKQEINDTLDQIPIITVAMEAFKPLLLIKKQIDKLLSSIESDHDPRKIEKLSSLQTEFELKGGYSLQSQAEEILEGIGFKTSDLNRPMGEFSGGWKMRVMLAQLLLEKPAILMLDEPTNHLDLPSIQWFEGYIKNYEGAAIIVSHDKQFLDNTVNKIIEIEDLQLNQYSGNYTSFVNEKTSRMEIQNNAHLNQQKKIKEAEKFINRFRAKSTKARQVQSKLKLMEKIDIVEKSKDQIKTINFAFRFDKPSGKHVLDIENLSKSFDQLQIFNNTSANITKGDKIALIGANGLGKSTLLKIIADTISFNGSVKFGYNVIASYYAQHQVDALTFKNDALSELLLTGTGYTELELRSILGSFLFSGDDVYKKIENLSGGEKARVALAKTLISNANFLILDEPTNHLDIFSVDILISALEQYQGSLIMVSHDRQFINKVANKIWYIENQKIKEYIGSFDEYEYWIRNIKVDSSSLQKNKAEEKKLKALKNLSFEEQKNYKKKQRSLENKLTQIEEKMSSLEREKEEVEHQMAKPENYSDFDKLSELTDKSDSIKKQLGETNANWEKIYIELSELADI